MASVKAIHSTTFDDTTLKNLEKSWMLARSAGAASGLLASHDEGTEDCLCQSYHGQALIYHISKLR